MLAASDKRMRAENDKHRDALEATDTHPADILAALHKAGHTLRQLAFANGYAKDTLRAALTRSYPAAELIIANALGVPVSLIWPERVRLRELRRARRVLRGPVGAPGRNP